MAPIITDHSTLGQRLDRLGGRPSGFDYMRLALAVVVLAWHTIVVTRGPEAATAAISGPWRPILMLVLPVFFSVSGFLVAGSLERCRTPITFLGLRVLRIGPALVCAVILTALVIGPIFTALPLSRYFASPEFRVYWLNLADKIQFVLPGVFQANPSQNVVNGQFRTIPLEIVCYAACAALGVSKLARRPGVVLGLVVLARAFLAWRVIVSPHAADSLPTPETLILCAMTGVAFYLMRQRIVWSAALAFVALALSLALMATPNADRLTALPVTYFTVWLGLCNPKRSRLLLGGDYSYGIYIYSYVVQQIAWVMFPLGRVWWGNFLIAAPLTLMVAVVSWRWLEKPSLQQKRRVERLETRIMDVVGDWMSAFGRRGRAYSAAWALGKR